MKQCVQRILPVINRIVIFSTTNYSFYGHPDPLNGLEHMSRKSLALYYYSIGRPEEKKSGDHSTLFKLKPGEELEGGPYIEGQKIPSSMVHEVLELNLPDFSIHSCPFHTYESLNL